MKTKIKLLLITALAFPVFMVSSGLGQSQPDRSGGGGSAKPMTVPVTIRVRESKGVEMRFADYLLREDGDIQTPLSMRSREDSPMWLAILIQDDLVSSISNEMKGLSEFINHLPAGSRVMIGYIRSGTLDVRRKRSEEHTSELQSQSNLVCRLLLEKKKKKHRLCPHITKTCLLESGLVL